MSGMSTRWNWFLGIASWCAFGFAVSQTLTLECNCAFAQSNIVPDNTLGAESSVVTPNVNINGINSDRISGGAIRSANLFHSFQEFNIDSGRGAYFTNPTGIENILSRVTGGNRSEIFGKLGVLGNANLFLINPNGIIFGRNASWMSGFVCRDGQRRRSAWQSRFFSASNPEVLHPC
jgi:filamentous hemagglutinin family protein